MPLTVLSVLHLLAVEDVIVVHICKEVSVLRVVLLHILEIILLEFACNVTLLVYLVMDLQQLTVLLALQEL